MATAALPGDMTAASDDEHHQLFTGKVHFLVSSPHSRRRAVGAAGSDPGEVHHHVGAGPCLAQVRHQTGKSGLNAHQLQGMAHLCEFNSA